MCVKKKLYKKVKAVMLQRTWAQNNFTEVTDAFCTLTALKLT